MEILPSGELDYTPEVLRELDFVIGSVHSHFSMDRDAMTKRILKAMENPYLTMLGHPTGRLLLERPPYEVDLEAVLAKAAEKGVVIEFNANPYRLDLDWTLDPPSQGDGGLDRCQPGRPQPARTRWPGATCRWPVRAGWKGRMSLTPGPPWRQQSIFPGRRQRF